MAVVAPHKAASAPAAHPESHLIRPGDKLPGGVIPDHLVSPEWVSVDNPLPCDNDDTLESKVWGLSKGGTMMESVDENPRGYFSIIFRRLNGEWRGHKYPVTKITYLIVLDGKGQLRPSWAGANHNTTFRTASGPVYCTQSGRERTLIMRPDGTFLEIWKAPNTLGSPGARGASISYPSIAVWAARRGLKLGEVVTHA